MDQPPRGVSIVMAEPETFQRLIQEVRAGNGPAAEELVRRYEPMIRRAARVRLSDHRLGRMFDSMDICQSVLASFFVRAALGQYEIATPDQLLKLLATMARNKLANQANAQRASCRDVRRVDAGAVDADLAGRDPTPSGQVAARELLEQAWACFTPDELRMIELRREGVEWAEVAAEMGGTAEALRKRYQRAVDRVAHDLGLDDPDDG